VIRDVVGRRPAREGGLRLEAEKVGTDNRQTVVHAYGVGGRGFELSWGVAEDVIELMLQEALLQEEPLLVPSL
jgi:D-amino-acid oxidase